MEKEQALAADVAELSEQDQDLDDQLLLDAESLQAKSDDISALLQKNEDIKVRSAHIFSSPPLFFCSSSPPVLGGLFITVALQKWHKSSLRLLILLRHRRSPSPSTSLAPSPRVFARTLAGGESCAQATDRRNEAEARGENLPRQGRGAPGAGLQGEPRQGLGHQVRRRAVHHDKAQGRLSRETKR